MPDSEGNRAPLEVADLRDLRGKSKLKALFKGLFIQGELRAVVRVVTAGGPSAWQAPTSRNRRRHSSSRPNGLSLHSSKPEHSGDSSETQRKKCDAKSRSPCVWLVAC